MADQWTKIQFFGLTLSTDPDPDLLRLHICSHSSNPWTTPSPRTVVPHQNILLSLHLSSLTSAALHGSHLLIYYTHILFMTSFFFPNHLSLHISLASPGHHVDPPQRQGSVIVCASGGIHSIGAQRLNIQLVHKLRGMKEENRSDDGGDKAQKEQAG